MGVEDSSQGSRHIILGMSISLGRCPAKNLMPQDMHSTNLVHLWLAVALKNWWRIVLFT